MPFPPSGDRPDAGTELSSPELWVVSCREPPEKSQRNVCLDLPPIFFFPPLACLLFDVELLELFVYFAN